MVRIAECERVVGHGRAHEHLEELYAADRGGGLKSAIGVAADDTLHLDVGDGVGKDMVLAHVAKREGGHR